MSRDFVSFIIHRSGMIMTVGLILIMLLGLVISNIIIIQEIYTHTDVMGWSILTVVEFLFFMCSIEAVKLMISLILSYDKERVFASAREEMIAEQKSTMRRIAKIIRVLRY